MKRITIRQARVADLLRETISELLLRKIKDPRTEGVIITDVEVSVDLKVAHVFFTTFDESKTESALEGLNSAEGFLRREMKKMLRLRFVPELTFIHDSSIEYGNRIDTLLDEIEKDGKPNS